MNNNFIPNYKTLTRIPLFRRAVLQSFPFIEEDFDALTDYELLCKVVEYLNKVIEQQNLVGENTDELLRVYLQLKEYVDNYFDNLDLQEEINNKLDEMVESGQLQAIIFDKMQYVTYEMFGAKLDGETDDTEAVINTHNYANLHNLKVVQKRGTLYIPSATLNNCPIINTDCDLTGMKIKFDNNSDNKTVMIIADPNTLTEDKNIQNIDLSAGQISYLSKTNTSSISFLEDYKNHYVVFETDMKIGVRTLGYGEDVYYSQGFEVNDLQQLQPNNMYTDISLNAESVNMKYLPLNQKHLTIKLPEINIDGNVDNNPMILVMRNNVELLDCIINKTNYNNTTEWSQPLFRCRYCCNLTIKNWVGENVSNEPTNTDITSYIIAIDKCFNVLYENNNLLKAHGCFVSYHTNFINFINNVCDRFDNHYGLFGNINITNNSFISFPAGVNLGYGDGQVNIINNSFYKYNENGKEFGEDCVIARTDLTVLYAGSINIENTYIEAKSTTNNKYVTLFAYIPTKNEYSIFPEFGNYNIPNISIKNTKYNTNVFERSIRLYNNITSEDNVYTLQNIYIDNLSVSKNTSIISIGNGISVKNGTSIKINNEKLNITETDGSLYIYALNNCSLQSSNSNTNIRCYINGDAGNYHGKFKSIENRGVNTIYGTSELINNFGQLNTGNENLVVTSSLYSNGRIDSTGDIQSTNSYISGYYFKCKNFIVNTKSVITGTYVEINNSVTNNGEIYLTGNYMYSSVAGRFNNGTINGNGNWAGSNSNIVNTL